MYTDRQLGPRMEFLGGAIRDLHAELEKLNQVIAIMEECQRTGTLLARRGRKSMIEAERRLVSERMKKSWSSKHTSRLARPSTSLCVGKPAHLSSGRPCVGV